MALSFFTIAIAGVAVCGFGGIVSLTTLIISILSWMIIRKWRTFKNYVFLNIIFSFNAIYCLPIILLLSDFAEQKLIFIAMDIIMNFFMFASCCWLMVMAMLFYTDLVNVFGNTMTRRVLKCNLFGWGLPLVVSICKTVYKTTVLAYNLNLLEDIAVVYHEYFYYEEIVQNIVMIILLAVNFSVYIMVVWSLMKNLNITKSSGNRAKKVQVATLAFIMSGILLMVSILMTIVMLFGKKDKYYLYPLGLAMFGVQTTVINICFLILRTNRIVWKQYFVTLKRAKREEENKMEMFENVPLNK